MKEFIDQMNLTIRLENTPRRIVSLVPSQTQLLHELNLHEEVVGITKFCIHPEQWFHSKNRVGGTKTVDIDAVRLLKPDLIIGNKEENEESDIKALREIAPVWMSDVFTLNDALKMIESIGEITERTIMSNELSEKIRERFNLLEGHVKKCSNSKSVLYFIWNDPNMSAGQHTFINDMLNKCGLENLVKEDRYPIAPINTAPDYIFLSSEPYPFSEKHVSEYQALYPNSKIVLVDGEQFSWYGSKLKDAPDYFMDLLDKLSIQHESN